MEEKELKRSMEEVVGQGQKIWEDEGRGEKNTVKRDKDGRRERREGKWRRRKGKRREDRRGRRVKGGR